MKSLIFSRGLAYVSQIIIICLFAALLPLDSAQAGDNIVGDGFGGRGWYVPSGMEASAEVGAYVDPSGQLYLWGATQNAYPLINPVPPTSANAICSYPVTAFGDVKVISLANRLGALVNNDGTAYFWGAGNFQGYIHSGQPYERTPLQVLTDVKHVSTGLTHIAFVKNDGTVWSIGSNRYGAFGVGSTDTSFVTTPVQMTGMTNAVRVAAFGTGGNATQFSGTLYRGGTLILKDDGTVWATGGGGTLVSNNPNNSATQLLITNVVDIDAGNYHAMALDSNGDVYTWGGDYYSVLGHDHSQGTASYTHTPTKVNFPIGTPPIVAIEADEDGVVSFALDETGTLWGWGYQNQTNLLGIATQTTARTPVPVAHHVTDITVSSDVAYIVRDNSYPADARLWWTTRGNQIRAMTLNAEMRPFSSHAGSPQTRSEWDLGAGSDTWAPSRPLESCNMPVDFSGMPGATGPSAVGSGAMVGTLDCDGTYIIGDLAVGTESEVVFKLSVDATTAGTGDFTISGSGFSVKGEPYIVGTTTTGPQSFHVPVLYDGSPLGSVTFGVDGLTSACTADLSAVTPTPIISPMTILPIGEFCTPVTPATLSK